MVATTQEINQKIHKKGIEVRALSKRYGKHAVLDKVDLYLPAGRIYGLLGRNGVGKSTLMNILTQKIIPTSGEVFIDGVSLADEQCDLSCLFMTGNDDVFLKYFKISQVFKTLRVMSPAFDMECAQQWADKFGLRMNMKTGKMSTGQASLLKNAIALSMNVPYLLLDEPVLGLDAAHRDMLYKAILERYMDNPELTVIISSHLIEEISDVIQEIVIIDDAKVLLHESVEDIKTQGYTVSGRSEDVDAYLAGLHDAEILGRDVLGPMHMVYIMGQKDPSYISQLPCKERLGFDDMSLQKLFIKLTTGQGGTQ